MATRNCIYFRTKQIVFTFEQNIILLNLKQNNLSNLSNESSNDKKNTEFIQYNTFSILKKKDIMNRQHNIIRELCNSHDIFLKKEIET